MAHDMCLTVDAATFGHGADDGAVAVSGNGLDMRLRLAVFGGCS